MCNFGPPQLTTLTTSKQPNMSSNDPQKSGFTTPINLFRRTSSLAFPTNANAVTQSPLDHGDDSQTVATTRQNHSDHVYHSMFYDDDHFPGQSPQFQSPTVARMPIVPQDSPEFDRRVAVALVELSQSNRDKRQASRDTLNT